MILLLTFLAIVIVGHLANVTVSVAVEQVSEAASLVVFFVLFAVVMVGGWLLAVRLTEHFTARAHRAR
jgi:hypothetical protein